ncbi:DUF2339 domain-containing protein [Lutimonas zeaxanthinifaciens]|uniref:DUF2339 domain-containing protein n=1 Tax=Lutimonas zeaxanthinifaciens TaxID=3060215 RepID=UPI00265D4626|nr:DUF2339 domain-containing protein [Lutimonas sp. YSD2104]WKK66320.1 DUF2339 domain-containing protein [Lutimonas sp. YSD2104]
MSDNPDQIKLLLEKLELLLKQQEDFSGEINQLKEDIYALKKSKYSLDPEKDARDFEASNKEKIGKPEFKTNDEKTGESVREIHQEISHTHTTRPVSSFKPKKLCRNTSYSIFGGVCAGIADYLNLNKLLIRFLWSLLTLFFGIGILIYIILWIAMPSDRKVQQRTLAARPKESVTLQGTVAPKGSGEHKSRASDEKQIQKRKSLDNLVNLEKFIGENLINKIGIAILIIGVGIGTKYSIEHDLISPLTRIVLGYLVGIGLLGIGMKLKVKYENFSAVLVSGAMAIFYFITFAAYSFYDLFPQILTFVLMVVFTVFTVIAALNYNKEIIGLIGLVGAYAVPFLLSRDSGNAAVLFGYISVINIGILILAFKKYWKIIFFSSFALTWLIFFSWYGTSFELETQFGLCLTYLVVFFAIFYITFLAFKLIKKEKYGTLDIILILLNSLIFYGIGYATLEDHVPGNNFLGLFTLLNGLIHFIVSFVIYRQKLADKNLFYLISGLVLVFITITIPVQLDGNWVTLLWVGEAALLFWIGRSKQIRIYEQISYVLMILSVSSLIQDWSTQYNLSTMDFQNGEITPILNTYFLSSVVFIAAFLFINWIHTKTEFQSNENENRSQNSRILYFSLPAILILGIYGAFVVEIQNYWNQLFIYSVIESDGYNEAMNYDLLDFKRIWIINFSLVFLTILSFLNMKKFRNKDLGTINLLLNVAVIFVFLVQGLYVLSELRDSYLNRELSSFYEIGQFNILIRYLSLTFLAIILFASYKYILQEFMNIKNKPLPELFLYFTVLWVVSSELLNLMALAGNSESYKLGLSILWGIFSLIMISIGIWKHKKHLRIGAIVLFGVTLIKLFLYDVSQLNTLSKTILFLALGVLLLIISFLYNKFKTVISDESDSEG